MKDRTLMPYLPESPVAPGGLPDMRRGPHSGFRQAADTPLPGKGRPAARALLLLFLICLLLYAGGRTAPAQEFATLDNSYQEKEPGYYARLSIEYLDSERDSSQTGYYDLFQKKTQKAGNGSLKLYFFNLDGHYQAYDSKIRSGDDQTSLSSSRDAISARAEFLRYFYLFAEKRNLEWHYRQIADGVENVTENESASALLQGIGLVFGDWRLGFSLNTSYAWNYRVDVMEQSLIHEDIEFTVNVWELAKKAANTRGPFYELGLKTWQDSSVREGRSGSLQLHEGFLLLGIGFSENTALYAGGRASAGSIESRLRLDDSRALRESGRAGNVLGVRFGLGDERGIYIERQCMNHEIEFENISYENSHRHREEKLTIGAMASNRLSVELKLGKTRIDKSYAERVVSGQSYRYRQDDNLIGVSVNMRFSE